MSMTTDQATTIRHWMLAKLENEHKATMAVLDHVPEDKLGYTPADKLRPFGELMLHPYQAGMFFAGIMETGKLDLSGGGDREKPEVPGTKKALAAACHELNRATIEKVSSFPVEALVQNVDMGNYGTFPAITMLDWHVSHIVHHRAQLTVYLRTLGAKVPATYGDSLDYPLNR